MGTIVKALIAIIVAGLLGVEVWLQHQQIAAEQQKNTALTQDVKDKDATIQQLQEAEANNKKRLAKLQTENQRIGVTLAERETLLERLHHDDPQVQAWADTPLPDAIVRLRQHAAATGASDYHPELSGRDTLHAASGEPDH